MAVRALFPARGGGRGVGNDRGTGRDGPGSAHPAARLASTWAIQSSREIVNLLFHDCGSMAVFEENPFERRLRDIDTVAQQGQGRILHYETVGQVMLGVSPENIF